MNSKRHYLITIAPFALGVLVGVGGAYLARQPTPEENKAALKAAMLEALAERFPIFGPRGDTFDLAEERRRAEADPIGTLEFDLWLERREASKERLASAAKDYRADGATKEALERLLSVIHEEIAAAEDRGRGR